MRELVKVLLSYPSNAFISIHHIRFLFPTPLHIRSHSKIVKSYSVHNSYLQGLNLRFISCNPLHPLCPMNLHPLLFQLKGKRKGWKQASLLVDPIFQRKKESKKQGSKACYSHQINYSNPLFTVFVKGIQRKAA